MASEKIIPLRLSDGETIKVEVTQIGEQPVSSETRIFKKATVKPDKFSVTFGLEIAVESGELTALIVKGTGKANLEITMEWGE